MDKTSPYKSMCSEVVIALQYSTKQVQAEFKHQQNNSEQLLMKMKITWVSVEVHFSPSPQLQFFSSSVKKQRISSSSTNVLQQFDPFPSSNLVCAFINLILQISMKALCCCKAGKHLYRDEYCSWLPVCHAKCSDVLASLQTQTIITPVTQHSWALNVHRTHFKAFSASIPFSLLNPLNESQAKQTVWGK